MIGVGLILLGLFFFSLSLMFMLDRGFLILANVSFLMGTVALLGPTEALGFFTRDSKKKASGVYFAGMAVIILNFPFCTLLGFCMQIYGIYLLFKTFLGTAWCYALNMPVVGPFLNKIPGIHNAVNWLAKSSNTPSSYGHSNLKQERDFEI